MFAWVKQPALKAFALRKDGVVQPFGFLLLSILIGLGGGLGAAAFRALIALFHNVFFLGKISFYMNANEHTSASPWGLGIIAVPVLGSLIVTFLVKNFAPEAKGHGVPEVIDAIYYNEGVVRPIVGFIKSVASALSIGSGGSVGREGPIIQIGSALGSWAGQVLRMPPWQRITLLAAGAGAGIAATFNTPIGGVLFATEIVLNEVSAKTLVPVAIATATASYVGRLFFGISPSFVIPKLAEPYLRVTQPAILIAYVVLGILAGLASVAFIRSIYGLEDLFERRIPKSPYFRHALGMLLVGITFYVFWATTGHYYVEGVGYAAIQDIFSGQVPTLGLLALLAAAKLAVTALTLGSGGSGGVFSPSLFMGATLGAAFGTILTHLFPGFPLGPDGSPVAFAVAGMAGVVGGSTGAAVTAIVMVFEMTMDYSVVIPMTITVALAFGLRKLLCPQSIYTMKLFRRGHEVPDALQAEVYFIRHARDVMNTDFQLIDGHADRAALEAAHAARPTTRYFVVTEGDRVTGVLPTEKILAAASVAPGAAATAGAIANRAFAVVPAGAMLSEVIGRSRARQVSELLVTETRARQAPRDVRGVISPREIGDAFIDASGLFWLDSP